MYDYVTADAKQKTQLCENEAKEQVYLQNTTGYRTQDELSGLLNGGQQV